MFMKNRSTCPWLLYHLFNLYNFKPLGPFKNICKCAVLQGFQANAPELRTRIPETQGGKQKVGSFAFFFCFELRKKPTLCFVSEGDNQIDVTTFLVSFPPGLEFQCRVPPNYESCPKVLYKLTCMPGIWHVFSTHFLTFRIELTFNT